MDLKTVRASCAYGAYSIRSLGPTSGFAAMDADRRAQG